MRRERNFQSTDFSFNKEPLTFYGKRNSIYKDKSPINSRKSTHLDELKTKLSEYLRQKSFKKIHHHHSKSQNMDEKKRKNEEKNFKIQKHPKKSGFKINQLLEDRLKKKKEEEKIDEDLKKMYRKSFTIKELHPEPKYKLTKQSLMSDQNYSKMFGSYYQIVALHKNFDKSQYYEKSFQVPQFFNQTTNFQLKDNPKKRLVPENRPQKKEKNDLLELKSFDGGIIEPWQNNEQNLLEIYQS